MVASKTSEQTPNRKFMTNRSQAVRLPKDLQFATDEVLIRKVGDDVILQRPKDRRS